MSISKSKFSRKNFILSMAHIILSGLFQPYGMVDWLKQSAFSWSNNPAASTMHSVAYHPLQVWFFPQIFACHCLLLPSISFFSPLKKSVGQEWAQKTNPLTLYRHIDKETRKVDILTHDLQFEHHCPVPIHILCFQTPCTYATSNGVVKGYNEYSGVGVPNFSLPWETLECRI